MMMLAQRLRVWLGNFDAAYEAMCAVFLSLALVQLEYSAAHLFGFAPPAFLEYWGTVFNLACVWLTLRRNLWCWPLGIIAVVFYAIMFYTTVPPLYGHGALHVAFFVLQFYGWWYWVKGVHGGPAPISVIPRFWPLLVLGVTMGTYIVGMSLLRYTDEWGQGLWAFVDVAIMWVSLIAQWLLNRKNLEAWALWIAVDVAGVCLYYHQGLYLVAGLYGIFLGLATLGLITWSIKWKRGEVLEEHAA